MNILCSVYRFPSEASETRYVLTLWRITVENPFLTFTAWGRRFLDVIYFELPGSCIPDSQLSMTWEGSLKSDDRKFTVQKIIQPIAYYNPSEQKYTSLVGDFDRPYCTFPSLFWHSQTNGIWYASLLLRYMWDFDSDITFKTGIKRVRVQYAAN